MPRPSLSSHWLILILLLCVPTFGWCQCPGLTTQVIGFAKEKLLISDVAKSLTASIYKPSGITPVLASISVGGGMIHYEVVGVPTAEDGHPASGTFFICGYDNITAFKAIRIATDALLTITYYKNK